MSIVLIALMYEIHRQLVVNLFIKSVSNRNYAEIRTLSKCVYCEDGKLKHSINAMERVNDLLDNNIPSMELSSITNLPWFNRNLKCLVDQKQRNLSYKVKRRGEKVIEIDPDQMRSFARGVVLKLQILTT